MLSPIHNHKTMNFGSYRARVAIVRDISEFKTIKDSNRADKLNQALNKGKSKVEQAKTDADIEQACKETFEEVLRVFEGSDEHDGMRGFVLVDRFQSDAHNWWNNSKN